MKNLKKSLALKKEVVRVLLHRELQQVAGANSVNFCATDNCSAACTTHCTTCV
jgi:hypothetical protein